MVTATAPDTAKRSTTKGSASKKAKPVKKSKSVVSDAMSLKKAKAKSHKQKGRQTEDSRRTSAEVLRTQEKRDRLAHISSTLAVNFNRAQRSIAADRKCFVALKKLQKESDKDEFLECFLRMIFPILLCFKRVPSVERLVRFVAAFSTHSSLEHLTRQQNAKQRQESSNNNDNINKDNNKDMDSVMSDEDEDEIDPSTVQFSFRVVDKLLSLADVKDKATRFRVCQIVGLIINSLPDSADIDEDLYQDLQDTFLRRLQDKIPAVRQMAIGVLYRLQDPTDATHEITEEFMRMMSTDASKDVRKEAINMLTVTKTTLNKFIERTRDAKDDVRAAAYAKIASTVALKRLTISQRVRLLKHGLKDRSKEVKATCLQMLFDQWLPQVGNDLVELLKCFDVENYTKTSEMVINLMMERAAMPADADADALDTLSSTQLKKVMEVELDLTNLTPEASLYWRCRCEYLSVKDPALLDQQLPTASEFCELIIAYHKEDSEFITKQLLMISRYLDYADEIGRQKMHALLANMLVTFTHPETFAHEIIATIKVIIAGNAYDFISTLVEKVDELRKAAAVCQREGVDDSQQALDERKEGVQKRIKSLTRKIKQLKNQERKHVDDEDYESAGNTKKERRICELEVVDLKEEYTQLERTHGDGTSAEVMLWVRALCIVGEFLNQSSANVDITQLTHLVHDFVLVTFDHENEYVRQHAYRVLGQFCCFKIELAKQNAGYFLRCLADENEDLEVQMTALRAVFDFIQLHGLAQLFEETSTDESVQGTEGDILITALKSFFTNEHSELRTIVVEGFAKLIMCNKLQEKHLPDILSRLIMSQFDPLTEKDERIRQCLPVFLPSYAFTFARNLKIMAQIVIPTLRRVANSADKPSDSHLSQLGQYLMYLSDPENLHQSQKDTLDIQELLIHEQIAIDLALEILSDPKSKAANCYCKLFNNMTIFSVNQDQIKVLRHLVRQVIGAISNKVTMRTLDKFDTTLVALVDGENLDLSEEQVKALAEKCEQFEKNRETFIEVMNEDELNFDIATAGIELQEELIVQEKGTTDDNVQQDEDNVVKQDNNSNSSEYNNDDNNNNSIFASPRSVRNGRTPDRRRSTRSLALDELERSQLMLEFDRLEDDSEEDLADGERGSHISSSTEESDVVTEENSKKRRKKVGKRASDQHAKESKKLRQVDDIPSQQQRQGNFKQISHDSSGEDDDEDDDELEKHIEDLEGLLDEEVVPTDKARSSRGGRIRQSVLDREIDGIVDNLLVSDEEDED